MTPAEIIDRLIESGPGDRRLKLLELRLWLQLLAFRIETAKLVDGGDVHTSIDAKQWLQDLADAAESALGHGQSVSTELILPSSADRTRPKVISAMDSSCPRCGHVHEAEQECNVEYAPGRRCRCDLPVPL